MKKLLKSIITAAAVYLLSLPPLSAQDDPQSFAFDTKHEIIAVINHSDNEIVIISQKEDGKLEIAHQFQVDKAKGRRDEQLIYRPASVAICDGYVAFLASNRDSCYFAVLNLNGKLETKLSFPGAANAFSYHQPENKLYITSENETGFNLMVLDTRSGINHLDMKSVSVLHNNKACTSDETAGHNTGGSSMMTIVIIVVLIALLILYFLLKRMGKKQIEMLEHSKQERKEKSIEQKHEDVVSSVAVGDGVYAAIAAAIHLYGEELHDVENTVLTINKVSRTYSPWSSKIHGLNTYFKR